MCDPFIGQIVLFAGNFAPRGWAFCDGQLLDISTHQSLFAIVGTTYGGDGRTTFALPDLRGRVPLHPGAGPGLTKRRAGEYGGQESVTLTVDELPSHGHTAVGSHQEGDVPGPAEAVWARSNHGDRQYSFAPEVRLHPEAIQPEGGGQAHDNMPPYLGIRFIIALEGIFPSRA
jgi:microcystin-dependent protein